MVGRIKTREGKVDKKLPLASLEKVDVVNEQAYEFVVAAAGDTLLSLRVASRAEFAQWVNGLRAVLGMPDVDFEIIEAPDGSTFAGGLSEAMPPAYPSSSLPQLPSRASPPASGGLVAPPAAFAATAAQSPPPPAYAVSGSAARPAAPPRPTAPPAYQAGSLAALTSPAPAVAPASPAVAPSAAAVGMCAAETKSVGRARWPGGGERDNIFRVKARAEAMAQQDAEEIVIGRGDDEVDETAVFHDSDDEQEATESANLVAPDIVDQLREQFGQIRHWVYPCGVVCVTAAADHEAGLGLDASREATDAFTVLRGWGDAQGTSTLNLGCSRHGIYDVAMFKRQPRTTLVGFPHDAQVTDEAVGLRARALLLRDIAWCERDDLEFSSGDEFESVPAQNSASDRLRIRRLPPGPDAAVTYADGGFATDGMRMRAVKTPAGAGGVRESKTAAVEAASLGAAPAPVRPGPWVSAPELEEIAGEIIGTREQVLACLCLQDQYRAHRRRCLAHKRMVDASLGAAPAPVRPS